MADNNFVDYVKIFFRSGKGGQGSCHFRREKFVPKGGPDGGDGGRGGHIILKGNAQLWTLIHLKYRKHIFAEDGINGSGANCSGAMGNDVIVEVPLGTIARDPESRDILLEITQDGEEKILLPGGRGGLGNTNFTTSTNQAPNHSQPGEPGQEGWLILELKILADVGLVGFPNAGKSTLLSVVSAAKPLIADYPFTTLTPNLGIVNVFDDKSLVMADIPGIIEGAAEGKGLGVRFLRHIERNSILLFIVPADSKSIREEYNILLGELEKFNPELLHKDRVLAISKSDILDEELKAAIISEIPDMPHIFISSFTLSGVQDLKYLLWKKLTTNL